MEASVDIAVGFEPSWREVLEEAAKWGASKRLCTMFDIRVRVHFSSTAEFLRCDETRLVKSQRGLGKKMEMLVAHLRSFFCEDRYRKRKEEGRIAALDGDAGRSPCGRRADGALRYRRDGSHAHGRDAEGGPLRKGMTGKRKE